MTLDKSQKLGIIKKFQRSGSDTGSPEVQVALLTYQIEAVTKHLTKHSRDNHTRRGLVMMVSKRRRLLEYLREKSESRLEDLSRLLKLKK